MNLTINVCTLPHEDPDESLVFYRDVLGFEVRKDVRYAGQAWITVGPADQPDVNILLGPPVSDPGVTDEERRVITEMMAKGTYGWIMLAAPDVDAAFESVVTAGVEVVQEPTDQAWGTRDCAFRDPAGNLIRIQESH